MKKTKIQRVLWLCTTVLVASATYCSVVVLLLIKVWTSYEQLILIEEERITREASNEYRLLRELHNRYGEVGSNCDNILLQAMRDAEFKAHLLHDFLYLERNSIVCSTRFGVVNKLLELEGFNISTNSSDVRFSPSSTVFSADGSPDHKEMAVAVGRFAAYLRFSESALHELNWINNGVFLVTPENVHYLFGDESIVPNRSTQDRVISWFKDGVYHSQYCRNNNLCIVIQTNVWDYLASKVFVVVFLIVGFVTLNALCVFVVSRYHTKYISLERQLLRGLNKKRVMCSYQPILNLESNQFDYLEVLCRWVNEDNEVIRPDFFIEQIEENGQSKLLTDIVFRKAVEELSGAGLIKGLKFAINFFPSDISSGLAKELIDNVLGKELESRLTVELTEREIHDVDSVISEIRRIRKSSSLVAIDDFGTGYSNLQHLEKLKVDKLKIDKSFIDGIESNTLRTKLVLIIVELAEALDLVVVAEGVETEGQLKKIKEMGIHYSQGYLHSKPLPIDELKDFIDSSKTE
ncbi:EAL domain-containing protein [Pseudoalteromonas peptidolytica]|uniref:EAL domain-containing protein n=1 Tax=Pseudoalteromonas peptidolytica TaxID=61150 RepID=UPI00298EC62B|nr:EAL domain-containing protein [Pseudoalteromonas peptidolytica]MDW7550397.1 EAL domain-containing protein [Pseudoalteromonas peptidolytica]